MSCVSCGSSKQTEFASEIVHALIGLENVDKPTSYGIPQASDLHRLRLHRIQNAREQNCAF